MIARVLTALVLAPAAVFTVLSTPWWLFSLLVALVACACFLEFRRMAAGHGHDFTPMVGLAAGIAMLLAPASEAWLVAVAVLGAAWCLGLLEENLARVLPAGAALLAGVVYCFGGWRCALELRRIDPHWLLFTLALTWIGDAFAYFGGRAMGRHKMAPVLSPGKTWEGAAWSAAGSILFGFLFLGQVKPQMGLGAVAALSLTANAAGQLGDLLESALKRGAGLKESGQFLPGHGGWLDRVDSALLSMPAVLLWLTRF
ncbi:MAG: CDP-archaeol synthase [Acidobacteria bacterium]|nr:CDP-archaeol synthase [Acidobacteriota bacterium]